MSSPRCCCLSTAFEPVSSHCRCDVCTGNNSYFNYNNEVIQHINIVLYMSVCQLSICVHMYNIRTLKLIRFIYIPCKFGVCMHQKTKDDELRTYKQAMQRIYKRENKSDVDDKRTNLG